MRSHVVIAAFHGHGISLDTFVQSPQDTSYKWFVYVQCNKMCANTTQIQECATRDSCHLSYLPNIGRESRVYLHHILMMYHHLPPLLYFLQENEMHHLRLGMTPYKNKYVFYPGPLKLPCTGGSACAGNYCWQSSLGPIANRIMQTVYHRPCGSNSFNCSMRACFVVRREGIEQHPISTYIALTRILENASWIQIPKRCVSSHMFYGDYAGHAFERLWDTLFESEHNRLV